MSAPRTIVVSAAATLAALSIAPAASAAAPSAKASVVKITLTDEGCPKKITAPAGPTTFKVKNEDATSVSEFEILSGDRILGERENLAPGLSGEFSLTLKPGAYTTYCPGGEREKGKLIVTGTDTAKLSPAGKAAVDQYRAYVEDQAAQLVGRHQDVHRRGPGRRRRGRQGRLRRRADPLRADRAGRGDLRRPRPPHRCSRGRRAEEGLERLPPDRAGALHRRDDRGLRRHRRRSSSRTSSSSRV